MSVGVNIEPIVGIDLGTTNSEVAFIIDGQARVITDNDNGIVPSCVCEDKSGKIIVGIEAKNQAIIAPDRTVISIKRKMGSTEKVKMGKSEYLPQEISGFILRALKERAEKFLKRPITKAIITVPAYFTDAQRQATRDAGKIAGLDVVRIINEPTAAALAYESLNPETQKILVYDLGGGTFDVSIVKIEKGVVEVLSSTGNNRLGGDDFDNKIIDRLVEYCKNELKVNVAENPVAMARLKRAAENAKIALSSNPFAKIEEDHIAKKLFSSVHLSYELSRKDFENMIEKELNETMELVNHALKDASLTPSGIDKIILVGGSTRIPYISEMLKNKFGKQPHGEIDPDLCVALGAAIQAGREMGIDSSSILLDITPYTFGTSAIGFVDGYPCATKFVPLIERNTKLPVSKSEVFYTLYDNQEGVNISVYQGEKPNALDNIEIGKYYFKLTKAPANSPIILNYDLDVNGILKIKAVEKKTGREINAVIENAFSTLTEDEINNSKKRIEERWDIGREQEVSSDESTQQELPPDLADIIRQAEAKLEKASTEDQDDMIKLIEDIKEAFFEGNIDHARELKKELEDILYYIGE